VDENGTLTVDQQVTPPLLYLDYGPLRVAAKDFPDEFEDALVRSGGTLGLSWFHLRERTRVSDQTAGPLDALLERVWPRIALLQTAPDLVVETEDEAVREFFRGGTPRPPHLDGALLDLLCTTASRFPREVSLRGLLATYRRPEVRARVEAGWPAVVATYEQQLGAGRKRYYSDPAVRTRFQRLVMGPKRPVPTKYIFEEASRFMIKNYSGDPNDIDDFHHMVVPVSYANHVALDAKWKEAARQVQGRVREAGLLTHEAKVYSVNEVHKLITDVASPR
jgi:hypothetical protein